MTDLQSLRERVTREEARVVSNNEKIAQLAEIFEHLQSEVNCEEEKFNRDVQQAKDKLASLQEEAATLKAEMNRSTNDGERYVQVAAKMEAELRRVRVHLANHFLPTTTCADSAYDEADVDLLPSPSTMCLEVNATVPLKLAKTAVVDVQSAIEEIDSFSNSLLAPISHKALSNHFAQRHSVMFQLAVDDAIAEGRVTPDFSQIEDRNVLPHPLNVTRQIM